MSRKLVLSLCFATLLLSASSLCAATHLWTGATSGLFSDPSNWVGGSPSGDAAAVLTFPNGAARLSVTNDLTGLAPASISFTGSGYTISGNVLTVANTTISSTVSPNTIACDITVTGVLTFTSLPPWSSTPFAMNGAISGSGDIVINAQGGSVTFGGTTPNTYTGTTHVQWGGLYLAKPAGVNAVGGPLAVEGTTVVYHTGAVVLMANEQIPDTVPVLIGNSCTFSVNGYRETVGLLTLDSATVNDVNGRTGLLILAADVALKGYYTTIDAPLFLPATRTFSRTGDPGASVNVTDNFAGITGNPGAGLIFNDVSASLRGSWTGPVTLNNSRVSITNSATAVTVNTGGFLSGSTGPVISHGGSVGWVTVTGDLTLDAASTSVLAAYNGDAVSGNVTLGGAALQFSYGALARGAVHHLIDLTGAGTVTGTFGGIAEGSTTADGNFQVTYHGGSGNDVLVTDVSHVPVSITMTGPPSGLYTGDPATVVAQAWAYPPSGSSFPPMTGSITFRDGTTVLQTLPVNGNGAYTFTSATLGPGTHTVTATYSGDAIYAGVSSGPSVQFTINGRAAAVTSVTPSTIVSGVSTDLTIVGTGFAAGATLYVANYTISLFPTTFVSPQELHATIQLSSSVDKTFQITVRNPYAADSSAFPLSVTALPPPPPPQYDITFSPTAVTGNVTPGSKVYWLEAGLIGLGYALLVDYHDTILTDTDGDGLVQWTQTNPPSYGLNFAFVDSSGKYALRGVNNTPGAINLSAAVQLGPDGLLSRLVVPVTDDIEAMWVRPSVGGWRVDSHDGSPSDRDQASNDSVTVLASDFRPMQPGIPPPASFADGDVLVVFSAENLLGSVLHLTNPLPTPGPGVIEVPYTLAGRDTLPLTIRLNRTGGSDGTVTVDYATADDTAHAGVDYQATTGTVTFGPGEFLKSFSIPTINDGVYSGTRQFRLTLTPHGTTIKGGQTTFYPEIFDGDPYPVIRVAPAVTVNEGGSGVQYASVPVTLTGATRVPAGVSWYAYTDSGLPGSGTVTFAPGETAKSILVPYYGNTTQNANRTISMFIYGPSSATVGTANASILVVDDDLPRISIADAQVTEGTGGSTTITFHVSLLDPGIKTTTVAYATADATAKAGSDYTAVSGTLTFSPGQTLQNVSVPITPDAIHEGTELFALQLTNPVNGTIVRDTAAGTILDDDAEAVPPSVTIDDLDVPEGNADHDVNFTVHLSPAQTAPVSINYHSVDGTATASDYGPVTGVVTFPPGATTATIAVRILGDHTSEPDETFSIVLSAPATTATLVKDHATCTLRDDDSNAAPVVRAADISVVETNGPTTAVFTLTLSQPLTSDVYIQYATSDGTATAPSDYAATAGTAVIPAGSTTTVIPVVVNGDLLHEPNETFHLSLISTYVTIATPSVTATILDDDAAVALPSVTIDDLDVPEGNADHVVTFTVHLSPVQSAPLSVNYNSVDGAATSSDYQPVSGTLTFPAGQTTGSIVVHIIGDHTPEPDETFSIALSAPASVVTLVRDHATCTLRDDDTTGVPVLRVADVAVLETNGPTTAVFQLTLSQPATSDVQVQYSTADGTATAPSDYTAMAGTITIPAGATTATLPVVVNGDVLHEENETFHLNLTSAAVAIATPTATATILDDDPLPLPKRRGAGH